MDHEKQDREDLFFYKLQDRFDKRYVQKAEIVLIRLLVFGFAGLVLTGFISALGALVFNKI